LFEVPFYLIHPDILPEFLDSPLGEEMISKRNIKTVDLLKYGFILLVCSERDVLCSVNGEDSHSSLLVAKSTAANANEDSPVVSLHHFGRTHPLRALSVCYVMHTSGTTGQPTPVHVPHCCILPNILDLQERFGVCAGDTVFSAAPFTFDPYIVEMFLALSTGATLLIVSEYIKKSPSILAPILSTMATVLQITPSLAYLLGDLAMSELILSERSPVRVLAFGGEACPTFSKLTKWKHPKNSTRLFNLYGITEVSSWSMCYEVTSEDLSPSVENTEGNPHNSATQLNPSVPLGSLLLGTEFWVDARAHSNSSVVAGGGELLLGGHRRVCLVGSESTAIFGTLRRTGDIVHVDTEGRVFYAGRCDNQVKRLGHRINLEVIENVVLSKLPHLVHNCTMAAIPGAGETGIDRPILILYASLLPGVFKETERELSSILYCELMPFLPSHSLPDNIIVVGEFPLSSHGKIDKAELARKYPPLLSAQPIGKLLPRVLCADRLEEILGVLVEDNFGVKWEREGKLISDYGLDSFSLLRLSNIILERFPTFSSTSSDNDVLLFDMLSTKNLTSVADHLQQCLCEDQPSNHILDSKLGDGLPLDREVYVSSHPVSIHVEGEPLEKKLKVSCCPYVLSGSSCVGAIHSWRRGQYFCGSVLQHPTTSSAEDCGSVSCRTFKFEVKWRTNTRKCVDASPLVVHCATPSPSQTLDGSEHNTTSGHTMVYIGSHSGLFVAINWETGQTLWQIELPDRIESSAVISACGEYVTVGCYDGCLYVLSVASGEVYWQCKLSSEPIKSSPCVDMATGYVWCGSHNHCMYGLNIKKKVIVYEFDLGAGSCYSSPCVDYERQMLYFGTLGGKLIAIDLETSHLAWTWNAAKPIFCSPQILENGNVVFGVVDGYFYELDSSGNKVTSVDCSNSIFSSTCSVLVHDKESYFSCVLFGNHGNNVYCCESHDCELKVRWIFKGDSPFYSTPFVAMMSSLYVVCCCSTRGVLYVLDLVTGGMLGSMQFPGDVFSSPVALGYEIVVGCRDDFVYCVRLTVQ
jgi:acyl-CoA synthetase